MSFVPTLDIGQVGLRRVASGPDYRAARANSAHW